MKCWTALPHAPSSLAAEQRRLMQIDCQLTARIRQLQRMIAAEDAGEFAAGTHVFLPVAGSEIGSQRLIQSLVDLSHVVLSQQTIGDRRTARKCLGQRLPQPVLRTDARPGGGHGLRRMRRGTHRRRTDKRPSGRSL